MVYSHPWKPANYVIVDTDCGIDDLRAIILMLASPDIRVLAITVSSGVVDAETGYRKVKSLLKKFHHEGIPVGIFQHTSIQPEQCEQAINFSWGPGYEETGNIPAADEVIEYVFSNTNEKVTMICLGSLGLAAACHSGIKEYTRKIKSIIWSLNVNAGDDAFNFRLDKVSFNKISGNSVPLTIINNDPEDEVYTENLISSIREVPNDYSKSYALSLENLEQHCLFSDEQVVMWLHFPGLYSRQQDGHKDIYRFDTSNGFPAAEEAMLNILRGNTINRNQVIKSLPTDTSGYFDDIQPIYTATVEKFGREEWTACVMANEMHGHLGVYAVIGVKMGMRARDYFGAGVDELKVVSSAGLTPPFSCMNDGLQLSTGATLGHGLIEVDLSAEVSPIAVFEYMGRKVKVFLKDSCRKKIESEIQELSMIHGLDSNIYWELVRKAAIRYWSTWDRHEIFGITPLNR